VLVCLTANHQNANFATLEKLSVSGAGTAQSLMNQSPAITGAVVLATCNRFEAYLDIDENAQPAGITAVTLLSDATGVTPEELAESVTMLRGDAVIPHLFSVSSGLKSVVIGEDEIAGQVRRSLEQARETGTVSPNLERLFQSASRTSRGVKTRTAIGQAGRSMVRLALELAASRIADWTATRVLLIGTGQYAATTVAALRDRGSENITVFSPSGRASQFAVRQSVSATTDLAAAIADADIVITCTSYNEPVVTTDVVSPGKRRLVIDLGLPRNVHPSVGHVDGVDLLDLETIGLHAPLEELNATNEAHNMVIDAVAEYGAETAERTTASAVVALRQHVFSLLEAEVDRSKKRGTWSEESESSLRHLVGVLLHTPSVRARELARQGEGQSFVDALSALFNITVEAENVNSRTVAGADAAAEAEQKLA
jgi:glutamyl-tRNA reductase